MRSLLPSCSTATDRRTARSHRPGAVHFKQLRIRGGHPSHAKLLSASHPERPGGTPVDRTRALADLVHRLPRGSGGDTEHYLGVLDRVLEDRVVPSDDETLSGRKPRWSLLTEVGSELGEERAVDRHDPLASALAEHPHLMAGLVDVGELEGADLPGTKATEDHGEHDGPIPVGEQVGEEGGHVATLEGFG